MVAVSKSKGRPKTLDDGELASAGEVMADGALASGPKSRRRTQSRLYTLRAMERLGLVGDGELKRALVDRPALWWLVDEKGARWGILAELGRIRDREEFDAAVRWVLEYRPRTKEAVAEIRRLRTGKSRPPDTGELAEEIIRAVNGYGLRHPGIRREQALEALCSATADVADAARVNKAADRRVAP